MKPVFFVGGCSGSGSPQSMRISHPSIRSNSPLVTPVERNGFGSLTTALGLCFKDTAMFFDNGSGVVSVGRFISTGESKVVYGLQTHFHRDHLAGIQMNPLLFKKGMVNTMFAPNMGKLSFREILDYEFSTQIWPVSPPKSGCEMNVLNFEPGKVLNAFYGINTISLNHPCGCVGYRVSTSTGDVVVATDHELNDENSARFAEFVSGASLLYVDVQYRDAEYAGEVGICGGPKISRSGWGHSTPSSLFKSLVKCQRVPEIILVGHHDPERSDEDLKAFEKEIQELLSGFRKTVRFAREGDSFEL